MLRLGESIRRCGIALLLLFSLCPLHNAHAVIGTLDTVPAATLLYPYFEVDLSNANGKNTVIGLQNTSATAILGRVTLWSNTGVPIYNFNIYLTGYDSASFDMRSVLTGTLPLSASAGQDPTDTKSPKGSISQDINFASCTGQLPYGAVNAAFVADLQAMLTGHASTSEFPGQCVGTNAGDNVARGYLTIDTVNSCSGSGIPTSIPLAQYFDANFQMTSQNVLLGDYQLIDTSQQVQYLNNAIAVEASPGVGDYGGDYPAGSPLTSTPGNYTFYGRFVNWTTADHREPLATDWALQGDTGSDSAIVWRDPKVTPAAFSCAAGQPNYAPLGMEGITFFDRAGFPTILPPAPTVVNPFPPPLTFAPVATQLAPMNNTAMQLPAQKMSFVSMGLNASVAPAGPVPPVDPNASQSAVVILHGSKNQPTFSSGVTALPLDNASAPKHTGTLPGIY